MRHFLTAPNAVVLVQQNAVRAVGIHQRPRQSLGRSHYSRSFGFFQVKQGRCVTAWNNDALANLKLAAIKQSQCQFTFFDDLPLVRITVNDLAKETRITLWHRKVHIDSQVRSQARREYQGQDFVHQDDGHGVAN